jgi:D-beta-D-heptose 7-phosphate kinase/D-beta-D-heptose 1-phosphate adenosyltransferase
MKILVIGDSCKDVFIYGTANRLCPEAPVPVFIPKRKTETGGMAANVYENIESLGVDVDLITTAGETITKTRYVEEKTNHQIIRVDSDATKSQRVIGLEHIPYSNYCAVIISDYNKGFLEYDDIQYICSMHDTVFIDTKKIVNEKMLGARFIKINEHEYENNIAAGQYFKEFYDKLIVTMSGKGCKYMEKEFNVDEVEVRDNSGAGDSFISALTIEYCRSKDIDKSIIYANECATIAVQHKGVTKVGNHIKIY